MTLDQAKAIEPQTWIKVRGYSRPEGMEYLRWKLTRWVRPDQFRFVRPNGSRGMAVLTTSLLERMELE